MISDYHNSLDHITAKWPAYENGAKTVLQLIRNNITLINDGQSSIAVKEFVLIFDFGYLIDWDLEKTNFMNTAEVLNEFEK